MYFFYPDKDESTYLALNNAISQQDVFNFIDGKKFYCRVTDMTAKFTVANDVAESMYDLLETGFCKIGTKFRKIYRVVPPVRIDDGENNKYVFVCKLEFLPEKERHGNIRPDN